VQNDDEYRAINYFILALVVNFNLVCQICFVIML